MEKTQAAGLKGAILFLIRFYQKRVSPWLPRACRFHPTCSHYMVEAIEKWGLGRGLWLGLKRLARCHPWSEGGIDPVP